MDASSDRDIETRIRDWLWQPLEGAPLWRSAGLRAARLLWAVGRDLADGQLTLRAMSLVYTTLLSLVPLLAISFSVLKGFGVHNQIEPFLLEVLAPLGERSTEIAETMVSFVDNTQVGVLGAVGVALLFYTVISLMQKIEGAFNEVWQIDGQRSFTERLRDYITVLVTGPVLVFASLGITTTLAANETLVSVLEATALGWLFEILGRLVPIALVVLAFTFVYAFVPNTRVRLGAAFSGALVAGVLWNLAGSAFAAFMTGSSNVTVIYSGFATPILFMLWLYLGWLILLVGASLAFYRQHPEYLKGRRVAHGLSPLDRERVGLEALRRIGRAFEAGEPGPDASAIANAMGIPTEVVSLQLRAFERARLLAATADAPPCWLPARPWEDVSMAEVIAILQRSPPVETRAESAPHPSGPVAALLEQVDEALEARFGQLSLREFAGRD
jgi:membrane protein